MARGYAAFHTELAKHSVMLTKSYFSRFLIFLVLLATSGPAIIAERAGAGGRRSENEDTDFQVARDALAATAIRQGGIRRRVAQPGPLGAYKRSIGALLTTSFSQYRQLPRNGLGEYALRNGIGRPLIL